MSVLDLVLRETARATRMARVAGVLVPLGAAVALLTAGAMWLSRGRWLELPPLVPFVVWGAAIVGTLFLARELGRRIAARTTAQAVARAIEEEQRLRRGALTGLLEVAHEGGVFVTRAAESIGDALVGVQATPAPAHRRRLLRTAAFSTIAFANVVALASGSWTRRGDGWSALMNPVAAWRGTLLPALELTDAPRRLARGSAVTLGVTAVGRREVTLHWRLTGAGWRDTLLTVGVDGKASVMLAAVDADLALVASDGRAESDTAVVRVVDRPFLGDVTIRATYPAYLGRANERLDADLPLRLPAGTRLAFEGHSSESLAEVALAAEGARIKFAVSATTFSGGWTPTSSATWTWIARGERTEIADLPAPLAVEVLDDSLPRVEILEPIGEALVGTADRVGVEILAQDDNALTGVWLRRRIVDVRGAARDSAEYRLSDAHEGEWIGGVVQNMADLDLKPGDRVEIVVLARDAAPGMREGVSRTLTLRVPSTAEERAAANAASEAAVAAANAAAQAQGRLAERTETASRSRGDRGATAENRPNAQPNSPNRPGDPQSGRDRPAMGFESAEQAKEIAEQQRALQERVAGLEEAAREMEDRLRAAGALDTSLARQLQDAQRMLREAMTPEMSAALQRLEGASQELNADRTRQSLADLAEQQKRMRQQLEKSAEMLKRAALEGAMQTLGDQAKELAQAQQQFADSARAGAPDAQQAQQLAQRTRDMSAQMDALRERLERERANTGASQSERAQEEARRSEAALQEAMRQARDAQQGPQGSAQRQQAQQGARDAAEQAAQAMQQAAQSMQRARQGQVSEWKGELTDAIDQSVQEMMQLANEQEQLAAQAQQNPNDPSLRGKQAALQQGMEMAQQRLSEEAKKSALVSPRTQQMMEQAQQRVQQATRESAQSQRGQSPQSMQEAANSMRQAAAQLTRDRERANSAQSASGLPEMMQQMQQLAQQQGALNGQMQSLFPGAQQRPSQEALDATNRGRARELARSQREVARSLDEIGDNDPTGRAQEMAREARQLAQALDQGAVDPATQARQERLFRRMLDAGRALEQEQKDESQRRESRAARGTARFTPPGGPARGQAAERYAVPKWEELRGLSAEERRLVIEYFRRLNAEKSP
ncbi:MAG: hypothetical protein K8S21_02335 [Gemmatimonadetes bacterium]|nr:hypothetical protein [Gemmatimonadota bacterium]